MENKIADGVKEKLEPFLWLTSGVQKDQRQFENVLSFAEQHQMSILFGFAGVSEEAVHSQERIEAYEAVKARGLNAWLNTGVFHQKDGWPIVEKFANDPVKLKEYIRLLKEIIGVYHQYFPNQGRVLLWHEEPFFSHYGEDLPKPDRVEKLLKYGPDLFEMTIKAAREAAPNASMGLFIDPYWTPTIYPKLLPELEKRGVLPDFSFVDFYRGYRDPEHGIDTTNKQINEVFESVKKYGKGRPFYYLGESHTINNFYTPSKQAIDATVPLALNAGAVGLGWYIRTAYRKTDLTLNKPLEPFLPNIGEVDEKRFTTFSGERDRFMYAYLSSFEAMGLYQPEDRFDLWIYGDDFDLYENRLCLKNMSGDWVHIGDFGTYVGGDNPYSLSGRTGAVIFHAIDKNKFINKNGKIEAKIEVDAESNGSQIRSIAAMTYHGAERFVPEIEAGRLFTENKEYIQQHSISVKWWEETLPLKAGDAIEIKI